MWGCGILSGAWTVCGQVSLSSTPFAFPTIQKERFIFDRREWGQDIERRRECERERGEGKTPTDKMISAALGMNRDPSPCSSSLSVIGLGVGFWPILAKGIQRDVCLGFPRRLSSLIGEEEKPTFFYPFPSCLWPYPVRSQTWTHTCHSLASISGDVASTLRVAEWKGRGTLSP